MDDDGNKNLGGEGRWIWKEKKVAKCENNFESECNVREVIFLEWIWEILL